MSDSGREVDAGVLQVRLPSGWTVETVCGCDKAGDCAEDEKVRGYTDTGESGGQDKANWSGAVFEIRRDGELWTATWLDRRGSSAGRAVVHRISGVGERCVEWVVERARDTQEGDRV